LHGQTISLEAKMQPNPIVYIYAELDLMFRDRLNYVA
jgi:hypothetical protein